MTLTASYAGDAAFSPAASEPAYVSVTKVIATQSIPTLGESAAAMLALVLAALAGARLRRRRSR
jgi:hypothetical protein